MLHFFFLLLFFISKASKMITLETELYISQLQRWPKEGRHIMGQFDDNSIIVYQAYKPSIANYAVQHQKFGGQDFSWTVNIY